MQKIKEFLLNNNYDCYAEYEDRIYCKNDYLTLLIIKEKKDYVLKIAILCYFDRWANSGFEFKFKTEDEVIDYLNNDECIVAAITEFLYDIIQDCKWKKDYAKLNKTIDFLYNMTTNEE